MTPAHQRPQLPIGFAHRGGMAHFPENTLPAFEHAVALGAEGLESDVWITADGVPVLDHDGVIGRMRRKRPIAETTRSALPTHIPALVDLYTRCGTDFELSLDVKDDAAAVATMQVAADHGVLHRLWLCTPSRRQLKRWRAASDEVRLVDSVPIKEFSDDRAARIAALAPLGIDALNIRYPAWTPALVQAVHAEGRLAFAWGVQPSAVLDRMLAIGIDGIFSDHVERLVAAVTRRRRGPAARPG
jgi:glycerophosphoryl diester phosphodiesterase